MLSAILPFEGLCGKESSIKITQPVWQVLYKQEKCQEKSHGFVASLKKKKKNLINFPLMKTSTIATCEEDCGEGRVVERVRGMLAGTNMCVFKAGNVLALGQLSQSPPYL